MINSNFLCSGLYHEDYQHPPSPDHPSYRRLIRPARLTFPRLVSEPLQPFEDPSPLQPLSYMLLGSLRSSYLFLDLLRGLYRLVLGLPESEAKKDQGRGKERSMGKGAYFVYNSISSDRM
jgi:hypothetical protein